MRSLKSWRGGVLSSLVVSAGAILVWSPGESEAAWDGTHTIHLGDKVTAELNGAPLAEAHSYTFFAPSGSVLTTKLEVDAKADGLVPELLLYTYDGDPVDLGSAQAGNQVKNFSVPGTGNYTLRIRATAGTGIYRLTTKVKLPTTIKGTTTGVSFAFDAVSGMTLTAKAKPAKGSTAVPVITGLVYQLHPVDIGAGTTSKISGIRLPADATYSLAIDPGTLGQGVDVKVELKLGKSVTWVLGHIEDTQGLASQNRDKWLTSAHADHGALPFNNWNESPTRVVPKECAQCHSTPGYRDWLGTDGSAAGVVDAPAPIGTVVECDACHNDEAEALTSVTFPSGLTVSGLGKEARCMVCHQGRESTVSVEETIDEARNAAADPGAFDDDTVSSKITFQNVHYFAAGASLYGREAAGAYEYAEPNGEPSDAYLPQLSQRKSYDRKFTHVASKDTCIECHDPHTQKLRVEECATCHVNRLGNPVANYADIHEIRMSGTVNDFDGDGDVKEGIAFEINGLQVVLYAAIQDYAMRVAGSAISYDGDKYPYFFVAGTSTRYSSWTARLLRAAYNYQYSLKDPGAFAHNGKFVVEFLYDSILDLNDKLSALTPPSPVPDFAALKRNDPGHFDSSAEAYRHWDQEEEIGASCSRCHSIEGFRFVAEYGIDQTVPAELISGLSCETCHETGTSFAPQSHNPNPDKKPARIYVPNVKFPYPSTATSTQITNVTITNGANDTPAEDDSLICMTCHRGRESTLTIEASDVGGLVTNFTLSAKNSHYLPAGAVQYGKQAAGMYQYPGKTYLQRFDHDQAYTRPYPAQVNDRAKCSFCHMQDGSHAFLPVLNETCTYCHVNDTSLDTLTPAFRAQDNFDGNTATPPKAETAVFADRVYAAIRSYLKAAKAAGKQGAEWTLFSDGSNVPGVTSVGFYKDTNHDDVLAPAEAVSANASKFDSKSYRATFNYRFWFNEPGAWAHNPKYVLQVLYDAITELGGDTTGLTRPQ